MHFLSAPAASRQRPGSAPAMSRQRPSNVPAARNALVRFQRQRLQGSYIPAAPRLRPGNVPAASRQRPGNENTHARTSTNAQATKVSGRAIPFNVLFVQLFVHMRFLLKNSAAPKQHPDSAPAASRYPGNVPPLQQLWRCKFCFCAIHPSSQPASRLRHDFLNFLSCSKTASLFIVFFIKFEFLAQSAGGPVWPGHRLSCPLRVLWLQWEALQASLRWRGVELAFFELAFFKVTFRFHRLPSDSQPISFTDSPDDSPL